MKKHMLLLSMSVITILAAGAVFFTLRVFQAQEAALDSMMRSYVLDLADSVSDRLAGAGRVNMGHGRMMRFRMLSMSPLLPNGDAGGILVLTENGMVLTASAGAEKLVPLWRKGVPIDEPRTVQDDGGKQFCVVAKRVEGAGDGVFVLAAVSRTYLLGPMLGVRRLWMTLALLSSAAVFAGMLGLWMYLAVPLRRVAESVRNMKWGRDRLPPQERLSFCEVRELSNAVAELAGEAIVREELRTQYVSDIVRVQEDSRKRLARDLHDSPLQDVIAAIKRIQLARSGAPVSDKNLEMAEEVAQNAAREIRDYCDELSPSWVKLGLSSAMYENAGRLSRTFGVDVDISGAEEAESGSDISEEHVLAFVRILQEAVSNSARHGNASRVEVSFQKEDAPREGEASRLHFKIKDNGSGMAAHGETDYESLRATGHRGLAHIHERVQLLKGTMRLETEGGLMIDIDVPV